MWGVCGGIEDPFLSPELHRMLAVERNGKKDGSVEKAIKGAQKF
jgi:hypothetical protein